jgi:hypothetical protein
MSAYAVDSAMPWSTALWIGGMIAIPVGLLAAWIVGRKPSEPGNESSSGGTQPGVATRSCPQCGQKSSTRMPRCYHCGAPFDSKFPGTR